MVKALIFDVDGTLVDSVAIHAKAWQDAFDEFGHAVPFCELRGQIGKGGDELLPVFLSKDEIDAKGERLKARRSEILTERYLPKIKAFPKVRSLFERFRDDGIRIVLASSAKGDEVEIYKQRADIVDLVETQTSADDAARSKPHGDIFQAALDRMPGIDPTDAIVVGDTPYDAQAAEKVGLRTIGVLSGGFSERLLREAGCFAIYRDAADMLARYDDVLRDIGRA
jgi:HAD superfamily hydrolase (TIGR01549 family)